jgi:hypothetical protein
MMRKMNAHSTTACHAVNTLLVIIMPPLGFKLFN